jgi:hypothetical protein
MFKKLPLRKLTIFSGAVLVLGVTVCASPKTAQESQPPSTFFHGNRVTFTMPPLSAVEHLALGPVVVCVASAPNAQCFTPPKTNPPFGTAPTAGVIELKPGMDALVFEVSATAGGSGSKHLLAVLESQSGEGNSLANLTPNVTFGNQSQYVFWNVPSVSDMPLLVIADAAPSFGETTFDDHRFLITVYTFYQKFQIYMLRDEYLTSAKYPSLNRVSVINVLEPEREEILARLKAQH